MVYAGDRDIPFLEITSILLFHDYLAKAKDLYGLALNYRPERPTKKLIMRTGINNIELVQTLGEYFSRTLSKFLERYIPYIADPIDERTAEPSLQVRRVGKKTFITWS